MKESRIYYINQTFIVMDNPYNGGCPVIIMRSSGTPNLDELKEVKRILKLSSMELVGEPDFRSDGLWYHQVKEVSNG